MLPVIHLLVNATDGKGFIVDTLNVSRDAHSLLLRLQSTVRKMTDTVGSLTCTAHSCLYLLRHSDSSLLRCVCMHLVLLFFPLAFVLYTSHVCVQVRIKAFETWAMTTLIQKHHKSILRRIFQSMANNLLLASLHSWHKMMVMSNAGHTIVNLRQHMHTAVLFELSCLSQSKYRFSPMPLATTCSCTRVHV